VKDGVGVGRETKRLTARQVQTLSRPGRHADGDGLYLIIDDGGAKRWALLISASGRRREYGLGSLRDVGLPEARDKAAEARKAVRRGEDPRTPKIPSPTFLEASTALIEEMAPGWQGRDTEAHWRRALTLHAKAIGSVQVDAIETDHVLRVVRKLWREKPETGRKLRQRIEAVLDFATARGWRSGANPARLKGHMDRLLPKQNRTVKHHRALHHSKMPEFMIELTKAKGSAARALEWTIYTVAREGMTRFVVHGEVEGDVWTVPAVKMKEKGQGDFRIPLTDQALAAKASVLVGKPKPEDLIFPGARNRPMSDETMDAVLDRMGVDATPHGFRSTFRDWAYEETDHSREIIEAVMAHVVGDATERAYRRGEAMKKRRALLTDWADYITPRDQTEGEAAPPEQ
jgi:integrase